MKMELKFLAVILFFCAKDLYGMKRDKREKEQDKKNDYVVLELANNEDQDYLNFKDNIYVVLFSRAIAFSSECFKKLLNPNFTYRVSPQLIAFILQYGNESMNKNPFRHRDLLLPEGQDNLIYYNIFGVLCKGAFPDDKSSGNYKVQNIVVMFNQKSHAIEKVVMYDIIKDAYEVDLSAKEFYDYVYLNMQHVNKNLLKYLTITKDFKQKDSGQKGLSADEHLCLQHCPNFAIHDKALWQSREVLYFPMSHKKPIGFIRVI